MPGVVVGVLAGHHLDVLDDDVGGGERRQVAVHGDAPAGAVAGEGERGRRHRGVGAGGRRATRHARAEAEPDVLRLSQVVVAGEDLAGLDVGRRGAPVAEQVAGGGGGDVAQVRPVQVRQQTGDGAAVGEAGTAVGGEDRDVGLPGAAHRAHLARRVAAVVHRQIAAQPALDLLHVDHIRAVQAALLRLGDADVVDLHRQHPPGRPDPGERVGTGR